MGSFRLLIIDSSERLSWEEIQKRLKEQGAVVGATVDELADYLVEKNPEPGVYVAVGSARRRRGDIRAPAIGWPGCPGFVSMCVDEIVCKRNMRFAVLVS